MYVRWEKLTLANNDKTWISEIGRFFVDGFSRYAHVFVGTVQIVEEPWYISFRWYPENDERSTEYPYIDVKYRGQCGCLVTNFDHKFGTENCDSKVIFWKNVPKWIAISRFDNLKPWQRQRGPQTFYSPYGMLSIIIITNVPWETPTM